MHTLLDVRGSIPTLINITHGRSTTLTFSTTLPRGRINLCHGSRLSGFCTTVYDSPCRSFLCHQGKTQIHNCADSTLPPSRKIDRRAMRSNGHTPEGSNPRKITPDNSGASAISTPRKTRSLVFLSNHFTLPALTISEPYRCRWQVELFFKWIKQHLRIKKFYGNSENAVKTQIWIAISVYVLVAIVKKLMNLENSLYTILQILSVTLFEKTPILQAFSHTQCEKPGE